METELRAAVVDVAFGLRGRSLPREHRHLLAVALQQALPWLAGEEGAGVHRLNVVSGEGGEDLISGRTRLTLRVPRERAADAAALAGAELDLAGHRVVVGVPQQRELLPHGTLYAHLVSADSGDESAFLAEVSSQLAAMEVQCRPICGLWQSVGAQALVGCSLMLDGLTPQSSLRVLERGLGPHRQLGCGLFVPHKSTAAVGTPL